MLARTRRGSSGFNPRSRMGSDVFRQYALRVGDRFNPRSRMGSDQYGAAGVYKAALFQSTLPHGERHPTGTRDRDPAGVSIHAPAWGATRLRSPY